MSEKALVKSQGDKIHAIDLFRIIFTIFVVLRHYAPDQFINFVPFNIGGVRADLFFVMSGFFILPSMRKYDDKKMGTWDYIKSRWFRLAPSMLLVIVLAIMFGKLLVSDFIPYATMLYALAPDVIATNITPMWYIGALFWSQIFIFSVLLKSENRDKTTLWLGVMMLLGLAYMTVAGNFGNWRMDGFINTGLVRGLTCVSMGVLLYRAYQMIKIPKLPQWFWTGVEGILTVFILGGIMFMDKNSANYLSILIAFCVLMICMVNSLGWFSQALNKCKSLGTLGNYCYFAFVSQGLVGPLALKLSHDWRGEVIWLVVLPFFAAFLYETAASRIKRLWKK